MTLQNIDNKSKARIDLTASKPHSLKKLDNTSRHKRPVRVINIDIWDSYLVYENYSFSKQHNLANPRNPFQINESPNRDILYDLDSEEELMELLGEDVEDEGDFYGSEDLSGINAEKRRAGGCAPEDDQDLIEAGFIVPDDYFSDSESSDEEDQFPHETELEYQKRMQKKKLEREDKRQRHKFATALRQRMTSIFNLGNQMVPLVVTSFDEKTNAEKFKELNEYKATSLAQNVQTQKFVTLPIAVSRKESF